MNSNVPFTTQEFLNDIKFAERNIRDLAEIRGLGETVDPRVIVSVASSCPEAEKSLRKAQAAADVVFSQARRMLGTQNFGDALVAALEEINEYDRAQAEAKAEAKKNAAAKKAQG